MSVLFVDKIVEHWDQVAPTSVDTEMSAADSDRVDAVGEMSVQMSVDMSEISTENEHKLAAMSDTEIRAKQHELLSTLGNIQQQQC